MSLNDKIRSDTKKRHLQSPCIVKYGDCLVLIKQD